MDPRLNDATEVLHGETDLYTWRQNSNEMEIFIPWSKHKTLDLNKKKIVCEFKYNHLKLSIKGITYIDDDLYSAIVPDDSTWQFIVDTNDSKASTQNSTSSDEKKDMILAPPSEDTTPSKSQTIWITLTKKHGTTRNQHWPCCLKAELTKEREGNIRRLGPPVHQIDSSDRVGLRDSIASLRNR